MPFKIVEYFSLLVDEPYRVEKAIHRAFDNYKVRNEWFEIDDPLSFAQSVKAISEYQCPTIKVVEEKYEADEDMVERIRDFADQGLNLTEICYAAFGNKNGKIWNIVKAALE